MGCTDAPAEPLPFALLEEIGVGLTAFQVEIADPLYAWRGRSDDFPTSDFAESRYICASPGR
jgi:hypothetical protein